MEILVCIKQVPDTTRVEVDEETGVLKRDGIDSKMNPYDLYALETALEIKDKHSGKVHVLTMGPPQAERVIRESFMMGADKGALLTDKKFAGADVLATAYALSQGIKNVCSPDLIICGKMTTDGDTAQVGPEIAEFLGIPHISNVVKITEIKKSSIVVEMDMPHSIEVAEVSFPCLIAVEKDIYQPRLPSYKLKVQTKEWDIGHISLQDLVDNDEKHYGLNGSPTQVKRIFPPKGNDAHEIWKGASKVLADKLYDKLSELKYIGK